MSYSIRCGGVWLHQLAPVGEIKYSWGEHGPLAASWGMALPVGFLHPALTPGSTVEIFYAGSRVWRGALEEPNRDTWSCTAKGTSEILIDVANLAASTVGDPEDHYLDLGSVDTYDGARAATGQGTYSPEQIALGLVRDFDFVVDVTVPGGPINGMEVPVSQYGYNLRESLDKYTEVTGKRWMVDENGLLHIPAEPTTPTMALTPNVAEVGLSLENYYSRTYLKYLHHKEDGGTVMLDDGTVVDVVANIYHAAVAYSPDAWRWGPRERTLAYDLDVQITEGFAQAIVDALQAESVAAPTQGVTLTDGQLVTLGGTRIPLPLLRTNVMVRHFGVLDVPGARDVHEWVIDHFEMDTTNGTATITPRHIAPRTLAQVVQSMSGKPPRVVEFDSADFST